MKAPTHAPFAFTKVAQTSLQAGQIYFRDVSAIDRSSKFWVSLCEQVPQIQNHASGWSLRLQNAHRKKSAILVFRCVKSGGSSGPSLTSSRVRLANTTTLMEVPHV